MALKATIWTMLTATIHIQIRIVFESKTSPFLHQRIRHSDIHCPYSTVHIRNFLQLTDHKPYHLCLIACPDPAGLK